MTTRRQQMQCACLDAAVPITRPTIVTIYWFSWLEELWPVVLILSFVVALLVQTATAQLLPAITGITPSSGTAGSSLPATISGSNLSGATAVSFSGSGVTATIGTGGTASSLPITVTIAAGAATGTRAVSVTTVGGTSNTFTGFTVTPNPSSPAIKVSRNVLYFNAAVSGGNPANHSLAISNGGSGSLNWSAMASSTGNWLSVTPGSGTGAGMLTVSAAAGSLVSGTYTGTITITASGAVNSPVVVPVVFRIGPTITGPYTISTIAGVNMIVEGGAASAQQMSP